MLFTEINYSQKIAISPELDTKNDYFFDLLGKVGENILAFRQKNKKYILNIYDANLRRETQKTISIENKNTKIIGICQKKNDFTVFYTHKNKGNQIIKAAKFDQTGKKIDSVKVYQQKYFFSSKPYLFTYSEDKNRVLIYKIVGSKEMEFVEFDNKAFKRVYHKKAKFKDINLNYHFRKTVVSNDGNIYVLFEKKSSLFNKSSHKIVIESFYPASKKRKKTEKILKINTGNIELKYDNKNNILNIAGIVTKFYETKATGYYAYRFDGNMVFKNHILRYFEKDVLYSYYKLEHKKIKKNIRNLYIKDILLRNDGGIILVLEVKELVKRRIGRGFGIQERMDYNDIDYYYGNIILISIHEDGSKYWSKLFPKSQTSSNDYGIYSSFFLFKTPSMIRLVFNDEIKNQNQIIMFSVNPIGKAQRKSIFATDMYKLNLTFDRAIQISGKSFVVPSYKKDKLKLVLIEL